MKQTTRSVLRASLAGMLTLVLSATAGAADTSTSRSAQVQEAFGLRAATLVSLPVAARDDGTVVAAVPIAGRPALLHLTRHSVRADGYEVLHQLADGSLVRVDPGPARTLRGEVLGVADSIVAASLLDDGLYARIELPGGETWWVEPIAGRIKGGLPTEHVIYAGTDIIAPVANCAATEQMRIQPAVETFGRTSAAIQTAELACDADYEYFQQWGSGAATRIESVINGVNIQYERDVEITHTITTTIVRTSEPDPYSSTDAVTLLEQFRNHWLANHGNIQRDTAQLFTGKSIDGSTIGIAWINAVCTSFGFSMVQSDFNGTNSFGCTTDLSAHELGHNWGAGHCRCQRPQSYTMNASITCANRFHPSRTVPSIVGYRDSLSCLGGGSVCGDGNCDPGEDPCSCPQDCSAPPRTETNCSDGVDNDCDGQIDCADGDCGGDPACQGVGAAHVDCITYTTRGGSNGLKFMDIDITIVDDNSAAIAGATVDILLIGDQTYSGSAATDDSGSVSFTLRGGANVCWTVDVVNVTGSGITFDGTEPANQFCKGTDPTPDVSCR